MRYEAAIFPDGGFFFAVSAGKTAIVQVSPFIRRRFPQQYIVAVRKTAEAFDDIAMLDCKRQVTLAQRFAEFAAKLLIRQRF